MDKSNKNNGFKTPEGYFDNLSDRLMEKLAEDSSLLSEKDGFVVPENYFDTLKKNIDDKIDEEETKVIQLNPYRKYYFPVASVAAALLVLFAIDLNSPDSATFDDLVASDIESYFEDNDLELSSYEIAEVIPVDELEINDILENELSEDSVMEYLNDNIEDFEELNLDNDE